MCEALATAISSSWRFPQDWPSPHHQGAGLPTLRVEVVIDLSQRLSYIDPLSLPPSKNALEGNILQSFYRKRRSFQTNCSTERQQQTTLTLFIWINYIEIFLSFLTSSILSCNPVQGMKPKQTKNPKTTVVCSTNNPSHHNCSIQLLYIYIYILYHGYKNKIRYRRCATTHTHTHTVKTNHWKLYSPHWGQRYTR